MNTSTHKRYGLVPYIYIFTLSFFTLPFLHISFSFLAFLCMATPFALHLITKKNVWCRHYCPRASLTTVVGRKKGKYKLPPTIFRDGYLKKVMLTYFSLNLLFITGSTISVAIERMVAMPYIRLFIAIPLIPLPQLLDISMSSWMVHLSYRLYSMMLSSTILGIVFAILYRPRAWCAVCPVGTILKKIPTNKESK